MSLIKEVRTGDYLEFACKCGYAVYNDPRPLNWRFCPSCGEKWKRPSVESGTPGLVDPEREFAAPAPDMSRMGEKHIKPCRGCGNLILWARNEKTGKVAPLIKTVAGETPNIMAWFDESQDRWIYKIKGAKSEVRGTPEYINHFANCSHANDFKSESSSEQEQQQASIK